MWSETLPAPWRKHCRVFHGPTGATSLPWAELGPAAPRTARDRVMRGTGWRKGRERGAAALEGGEL